MKKLILLTLIIAGLAAFKSSDVRHITGTVLAKEDNLPIPGASVTVKGTRTFTVTDSKGHFAIDAASGSVLVFQFVGYQKQEIPLDKKDTMTVYLQPDNKSLSEVVVTGYGVKHKKDVAGSVSIVCVVCAAPILLGFVVGV